MDLTVRNVAELLNTSEKTIYRWIKNGSLPAYRMGEQYRFNRAELLEWSMTKKIGVSADLFRVPEGSDEVAPSLSEALDAGGVVYRVSGENKEAVLKAAIEAVRLPESVNREQLLQMLVAREALASTAIGDGIAIPHVRAPIISHASRPAIMLCFLDKAVEFGALDGRPVQCLFMIVSPTVRAHLQLLSRLAFVLRDPDFREALSKQPLREEIFAHLHRLESALPRGASSARE